MHKNFQNIVIQANAQLQLENFKEALALFQMAQTIAGDHDTAALEGIAYSFNQLENHAAALDAINQALERNASKQQIMRLHGLKGAILKRLERLDEASAAYQCAAGSEYAGYSELYNGACALCYLQKPMAAIPYLESALLMDPARGLAAAANDEDFVELRLLPAYEAMVARITQPQNAQRISDLFHLPAYHLRLRALEVAADWCLAKGEFHENWMDGALEVLTYTWDPRANDAYDKFAKAYVESGHAEIREALLNSILLYLSQFKTVEQYEKSGLNFLALSQVLQGIVGDKRSEFEDCTLQMLTDIAGFPSTLDRTDQLSTAISALMQIYGSLNWACGYNHECTFYSTFLDILDKHIVTHFFGIEEKLFAQNQRQKGLFRLFQAMDRLASSLGKQPHLDYSIQKELENLFYLAGYFVNADQNAKKYWNQTFPDVERAEGYWKLWISLSETSTSFLAKDAANQLPRNLHRMFIAKYPANPFGLKVKTLIESADA
jgi:hypothetical protein